MTSALTAAVVSLAWLTAAFAVGLLIGGAARLRDRVSGPPPVVTSAAQGDEAQQIVGTAR